ncbi:MAG: ATP-grasp domain-containing protein [Candidatus Thorarchaeota archaeon]
MNLKGTTVGVIGFNARPIACSLKRLGARVLVSDYWGDDDLMECCDQWVSVLHPQAGQRQRSPLNAPVHELLVNNFLAEFLEDVDFVVLGSGFDDHFETVALLEKRVRIVGNDSTTFRRARDRGQLLRLAKTLDLRYPLTIRVASLDDAVTAAGDIGYPCILRRTTSGGGGGIHFLRDEASLRDLWVGRDNLAKDGLLIQQFISGSDYSATVLGTGTSSRVISFQGQLIGMPSAGRNCDFVYCGNYWPPEDEIPTDLRETFESLAVSLGLRGYNGIDFVVDDDGRSWLLEINPRITGTLEMLELASDESLMALHVQACSGQLPSDAVIFRPAVKMIGFARRDGTVPDLVKFPNTVDRTPIGVTVQRGDPICSIIVTGSDLPSLYGLAVKTSLNIQQSVR